MHPTVTCDGVADFPIMLKEPQAAALLGVSVYWLQRSRWLGHGPAFIRYGRAIRYERNALLAWIDAHRVEGGAQ